jgi:SAM-dependent methyltransferase
MKNLANPGERYLREMSWEAKAQNNPLYGVMSVEDFATAGACPTSDQLERFFAEGRHKTAVFLLPWLAATSTPRTGRILEFGCGMGRLVNAVKSEYPDIVGVDVSHTMVARAASYVPGAEFRALDDSGRIPLGTASVDRIYSYAVFQHIRSWSVIVNAVREIGRVLKPGGLARLQFDMVYPPAFARSSGMRRHTHALESRSLLYGWARRFGLPIPALKLMTHDNWQGARPGYRQLGNVFRRAGLDTYGVEHFVDAPHLVWFELRRRDGDAGSA